MKPKNLLNQLADLELALSNFSFEELTARDAKRLKKSFDNFKTQLEKKFFGEETEPEKQPHSSEPNISADEHKQEMLIATVSHEIRTPLSGIIGFADLLQESDLSKVQEEQVKAIRSASNNLMDIINELLEYSKIVAGLEYYQKIDFRFTELVKDVSTLCHTLAQGKDIDLIIDVDPQIPDVLKGDPSKISQILLNLLGNSIKFVEKGNISLNISLIRERKEKVWIEFVISDTGIGISDDDLKHIFDSFKQADQHTFSKYGGTGLGLNIVKQIVEKLNGELEVSSRLGVGTTFRFTLAFDIGSSEFIANENVSSISPEELKGARVLVFEDNLMNQRLIEQRLNSWGVRTYITENAYYGLNLLEKTRIDMILMDLRMPVMNGFEVTRRIRNHQNDQIKQIPIIALTADFTVEDRNECEKNGINDYLLKPFQAEVLLNKMAGLFSGVEPDHLATPDKAYSYYESQKEPGLVDLEPALEDCMGDVDMLSELVELYKQNAVEFIGKLKIQLENQDFNSIRDAAHKIKCGLAMMNTHSLYFIVEQIHNNCRSIKDIDHLRKLYDCFLRKYTQVERALDNELTNLKAKDGRDYDE